MIATSNETHIGERSAETTVDELKAHLRERYDEFDESDTSSSETDGQAKTQSDSQSLYISEKQHIVWVPEGVDNLHNISLMGFTDAEGWDMAKGYYQDVDPEHPETDSKLGADTDEKGTVAYTDNQMGDFYGISHGDTTHVVQSDLVDTVAELVDVSPPQLLNSARIRVDQEVYPVMFDDYIPNGRVIVFPIQDRETGESPLCDLSF